MTTDPVELLLAWPALAHLAPVWAELTRRMSASDRPVRKIRVAGLDGAGQRALASVLGHRRLPAGPDVVVDLVELASKLELDQAQLRRICERLHGPIVNRAAEREADSIARARLWARAEARLAGRIPQTFARLRNTGVPGGDVEGHAQLLELLADVLQLLPTRTPMPLPMLAWQVSGDPHALDAQTSLGRLLQSAAVELVGEWVSEPDGAMVRRALQSLGVIADRLFWTIITYGIRARTSTPLGAVLDAGSSHGVPVSISGAMLDRGVPSFVDRRWLCVENPSLIELAALRNLDVPIVCTSGWPSVDVRRLLDGARQQGVELCYAGDYDREGLAIAGSMAARYGASIAMTAAAYTTADLERALGWDGTIPPTPWDPSLADEIRMRQRIVFQEDPAICDGLLAEHGKDG